jgi:hypothetical protein
MWKRMEGRQMENGLVAVGYGVFSAALVTVIYIGVTLMKQQQRRSRLQVKAFRYFRLRPDR